MESTSEQQLVDNVNEEPSAKKRAPRNRTLTLSAGDRRRLAGRVLRIENHDAKIPLPLDRTVCGDSFQCLPMAPKGVVDLVVLDPPVQPEQNVQWSGIRTTGSPRVHRVARRRLRPDSSTLEGDGIGLYLRRLVLLALDLRGRLEALRSAKPHYVGTRKGAWSQGELEELIRGRLVLHRLRSIHLPSRCRQATASRPCALHGSRWRAQRLDANGRRQFQGHLSIEFLVGHHRAILVDAGKHRPSDTEERKADREADSCQFESWRRRPDPFLGSGTTSVVARKLRRRFIGIELDYEVPVLLAERRLELGVDDTRIQGFDDGVFWERNSQPSARTQDGKVPTLDFA